MDPRRRFKFRLALALGCTVSELENRLQASELDEWYAFWSLEPWGEVRADYRAGLMCATVLNSQRVKGKLFEAKDFFDLYDAGKRTKQTGQQMLNFMKQFAATT